MFYKKIFRKYTWYINKYYLLIINKLFVLVMLSSVWWFSNTNQIPPKMNEIWYVCLVLLVSMVGLGIFKYICIYVRKHVWV